jgi:cell division protein FtsZ
MLFDLPKEETSIIKIVGVGGGGSNAVTHMYKQGIIGVDYCICNTDAQAMETSPVANKIHLGQHLTEGRGAGSKPEVGKRAAEESIDELVAFLENNTKMVFITAGMGGGTGTGAAPIIARTAKEMGILTVGIVTMPFTFEGQTRVRNGGDGLEELRKNVDCLVCISNDKLRQIFGSMSISEAFSQADNILCTAAKGIAEIITVAGYVNVDFEDVNTVMRNSGVAIMGAGVVEGENRARRAVDEALNSPLLENNNIVGAKHILLNITSGAKEASLEEMFEITEFIRQETGQDANLIWGNCYDERLGDKISVTIIATGFEENKRNEARKAEIDQRVIVHLDQSKPSNIDEILDTPVTNVFINSDQANTIEFDFNDAVDNYRKSASSFVADDLSAEERHRLIFERQRKRDEARNRQIQVTKLSTPQVLIDLENQPAYLRRNVQLDNVPPSHVDAYSTWTIDMQNDGELKQSTNKHIDRPVD